MAVMSKVVVIYRLSVVDHTRVIERGILSACARKELSLKTRGTG